MNTFITLRALESFVACQVSVVPECRIFSLLLFGLTAATAWLGLGPEPGLEPLQLLPSHDWG